MDPLTPAITPGTASPASMVPAENHVYFPQNQSPVPARSLLTISVCSVASESSCIPVARCPHCLEAIKLTDIEKSGLSVSSDDQKRIDDAGYLLGEGPHVDSATRTLLKTLQETDRDLKRIGQDLHQIHLLNPTPASSRTPSAQSLFALAKEQEKRPPPPGNSSLHPNNGAMSPSHRSEVASPFGPTSSSSSPTEPQLRSAAVGFQSGHPLIRDFGDLENLSQANIRLLKTLQDKVNKVDTMEKLLKTEREALDRERENVMQMKAEIDRERLRLMDRGLYWRSYGAQSSVTMSRGDSAGTTVDEWLKGEDGEAAVYEEWSEEKEQEMLMLEEKLRKAQMGWSDEQEEILGPLEKLREEKRHQAKAKRLERQTSIKFDRILSSDEKTEKGPSHKKSVDRSGSPTGSATRHSKNPFTNLVRKGSVGSVIPRRASSASTAITTPKLFKKWF
ncbi:hypothetical protein B9Z19DRAFT_1067954 [Tuber borchii]|uniref:Uncharacterized protein n=1 Tax=Tuber borchii TaxID=42251 RepID=A0A2T6ZH10_TUBBO|nr:hypothetical protein B9Z19DRAFT_1067954 [Tuber borchii]